MYQYAYVYKLSIISSFIEIILYNDIRIFAFPLYPYYQELITNLPLLLFKKVREGPLFEGEGGGSKGRSLIGACALIIRENKVTFQSETLWWWCQYSAILSASTVDKNTISQLARKTVTQI